MRNLLPRIVCLSIPLCAGPLQAASGLPAPASVVLSGIVSDAATGRPLPGQIVELWTDWEAGPIREPRRETTDAGGGYRFADLPPIEEPQHAAISVCAEAYGCESATLTDIRPGQDRRHDFRLSKPIAWNFRVAERGRPDRAIAGAHVAVVTPVLEGSLPGLPARAHIGRSDTAGQVRMHRAGDAWGTLYAPTSMWVEDALGASVQVTVSKAGYRMQAATLSIAPGALVLDAEGSPGQWILCDTFFLEPEAPGGARTLAGTVTDHAARPDGIAVLFSGVHEGRPFVLFDYVLGGRISIGGIPGAVREGSLHPGFGDSLPIVAEDFSRDIRLATRSPVPAGLAPGAAPERRRRQGRLLPGTGMGRVDVLGRTVAPFRGKSRVGGTGADSPGP